MPLITTTHDSLPYIDRPPSPASLAAARSLLQSSLPPSLPPHPLLPASPTSTSTTTTSPIPPTPLSAIDLSRYELLPPSTTITKPLSSSSTLLSTLHTSSQHLSARLQALALLEAHGRNAWLVGNADLEDLLRGYEEEIVQVGEEVQGVNRERKRVQEEGRAALEGGERAWRGAVEGLVRVGVAGRGGREVGGGGGKGEMR